MVCRRGFACRMGCGRRVGWGHRMSWGLPTTPQTHTDARLSPRARPPPGLICEDGVLQKYGVKVLGTQIDAIIATEDRAIFKDGIEARIVRRACQPHGGVAVVSFAICCIGE